MNTFTTGSLRAHSMMANSEFTAKRAEDSMSMVAMDLYNPPIPAGDPVAAQIFPPRMTSRTTIIRVRRTLSESEIERYARLDQTPIVTRSSVGHIDKTPIAISSALALSATSIRREQIHTHGTEVHEKGEGSDQKVLGVECIASVELGEKLALRTRTGDGGARRKTNQKTIG